METRPPTSAARRRRARTAFGSAAVVVAMLIGVACTDRAASSTQSAGVGDLADGGDGANAVVERVVDGDTLQVRVGSTTERARLIGIDTPESVKPDSPVECFGKEAAAFAARLLPEGSPVRLERDVEERDRYGRLLVYVFREPDGLFVNLEMARQGYASALTIPPDVAHADEIVAAVAEARSAGRGLWAACGDPG